ncbi:MAG: serine/threonine protein phosphatase [Planctomycetes bacterium]|nr:serine/threonine protein phosphatase [Planctomycetota bacterium]
MKLLLFSDLHSSTEHARRIVEQSRDCAIVIGAGDFGNVRQGVKEAVESIRTEKPTILVPGNNESDEELRDACADWPEAHVLHGTGVTVSGISFFGIGGGIPITPFGSWSFDLTEDQANGLLKNCPRQCVLVSHSPPFGILDSTSRGKSVGSVAVRDAILLYPPRLLVCGHVHESGGKSTRVQNTTVINAGPEGMIFDTKEWNQPFL